MEPPFQSHLTSFIHHFNFVHHNQPAQRIREEWIIFRLVKPKQRRLEAEQQAVCGSVPQGSHLVTRSGGRRSQDPPQIRYFTAQHNSGLPGLILQERESYPYTREQMSLYTTRKDELSEGTSPVPKPTLWLGSHCTKGFRQPIPPDLL